MASGGPSDPGSWNRFSYTRGDPINRNDARGLEDCGLVLGIGEDPGGCGGGGGRGIVDCGPGWTTDPSLQGPCGGPIKPTPPKPAPSCTITYSERGVPNALSPGIHTYLEVSNSATGLDDVLESGPSNHPRNPFGSWGQNIGYIEPVSGGKFLGGTNPSDPNQPLATDAGPSVCDQIRTLENEIRNYDQNPVDYKPVPRSGSGFYNSNSFTFTLLYDVGLVGSSGSGVFPRPDAWAPGWGLLVPGLY